MAVVRDAKVNRVAFPFEVDFCGLAAAIAMHVRQGFLDNAEDDEFDLARMTLEIVRNVQADVDAAALE
ncbi:MAG: hypothetical protein JO260_07980 [Acidobacteria bacterium]|nr:hypothetical protein [Acidobacteriota bacterium]